MKNIFYFLSILIFFSCGNSGTSSSSGPEFDLTGYNSSKINGSSSEFVFNLAGSGSLLNEGMVKNNVRDGVWISYYNDNDNRINIIANYDNGVLSGPYMELNDRGQLEKKMNYVNNEIHGLYVEYRFGRPEKAYMYDNGILHGVSKEFDNRGNLIKTTSYKNGELHGDIIQFDSDGNEILRYEYKNGEKISGGIVAPTAESEE